MRRSNNINDNKDLTERFLLGERSFESAQRTPTTAVANVVDFIRCVCGCTRFTRSDLQSMLFANMDGFMNNPASVKFFLGVCDSDTNSPGRKSMACYELCREILCNGLKVSDEDKEKLIDLCPSYEFEEEFNAALEGSETDLKEFLNKLMRECKFNIETSVEYHMYKEKLAEKCERLRLS